ncbi:outer membrane lipoprotein chaperone LolA [Granulicella arctica]|uniref:outer membrane lipoprotein chaperone LolA n=1 Tax=Granulicella arctica TaxID=940613 RepID=UPI0021DFC912|nr:outer membrane lipoprotein chaperone LolA [Granulicella arctica]
MRLADSSLDQGATIRPTLLLALCLSCLPALGQADDAILKRVDDHYNHLASLQAHYSEHYTGMGMDRNESGTLLLKKPGRMRWSYATPVGKVFILDGKNGWFYTPGDPQAQRVSAKQLDDLRSPLRFLLGHTQLKKELDTISVHPGPGGYQIAGIPKGMSQRVKLLTLDVDTKGLIVSMSLEEIDGATTTFTFSDMHENLPVKDGDFIFTPPSGVTVVDGLPPI